MRDHLVPIPTATAGTLAQLGWRRRDDVVEDRPGGPHEACQPLGVGRADRPLVERGDERRDAELGAAAALGLLDDLV